jgi:hypothetical protein
VVLGRGEGLADARGLDGAPQRLLRQQPREQEAQRGDGRADEEHRRQRIGVGADERRPRGGRQLGDHVAGDTARPDGGRKARELRELVGEAVGEDRAADRDAEAAADRAEERRARGRHAEVAVVDVVLDREHQHLHDEADSEAEDDHVERALETARRGLHRRQPPEADDHDRRAHDREGAIVTPARDDLAAADRGDEQPEDQRQQLEAGTRR